MVTDSPASQDFRRAAAALANRPCDCRYHESFRSQPACDAEGGGQRELATQRHVSRFEPSPSNREREPTPDNGREEAVLHANVRVVHGPSKGGRDEGGNVGPSAHRRTDRWPPTSGEQRARPAAAARTRTGGQRPSTGWERPYSGEHGKGERQTSCNRGWSLLKPLRSIELEESTWAALSMKARCTCASPANASQNRKGSAITIAKAVSASTRAALERARSLRTSAGTSRFTPARSPRLSGRQRTAIVAGRGCSAAGALGAGRTSDSKNASVVLRISRRM